MSTAGLSLDGVRGRVSALSWTLALFAFLPAVVVHEASHAAVGRSLGARVSVDRVLPTPRLCCEWTDDTPALAVVATQVAPAITGIVLLPVVVAIFGPAIWPVKVYLVASWLLVASLSRTDLAYIGDAMGWREG